MTGVRRANHSHHALAPDHLAFVTDFFDRRANLHEFVFFLTLLCSIGDPTPAQVVRRQLDLHLVPRKNSDEVHPHLPRNMSQNFVTVVELDAKHSVGQWFHHCPLDFDGISFRQSKIPISQTFTLRKARPDNTLPEGVQALHF